jgi:predicted MFS family arabinose efflux permease
MREKNTIKTAVLFVSVLGLAFILSQFLRASNAVIAPELVSDLSLDPADLGLLTGAFFIAFALVQIPVGLLLDRYGPRRVMTGSMTFAILGCYFFSQSQNLNDLVFSRILMGFGCSSILMGAYVIYARWFPSDRFALFTGVHLGIGNTGLLFATAPLALSVGAFGWRDTMAGVGIYTLIAAGLVFFLIKDVPTGHPITNREKETLWQSFKAQAFILRDRRIWPLIPLMAMGYSSVATISTLWSGPYLFDVFGLGIVDRGDVLFLMACGSIVGALGFGPLDRFFNTRKFVVLIGGSINFCFFLLLTFWPNPSLTIVTLLFVFIAFFAGYVMVLLTHIRTFFPDHLVGRGMTLGNMIHMLGVGFLQLTTGLIMNYFFDPSSPQVAFKIVFGFISLLLFFALLSYSKSVDTKPLPEK